MFQLPFFNLPTEFGEGKILSINGHLLEYAKRFVVNLSDKKRRVFHVSFRLDNKVILLKTIFIQKR